MKNFSFVAVLLCGVTAVSFAMAQARRPPPKDVSIINCSALKGAPQVCVLNESDDIVPDMDCKRKGFFGGTKTQGVEMPKGGVPAHSMTIVKFPSCKGTIAFTVLGGSERESGQVDTDQATMIEVPKH